MDGRRLSVNQRTFSHAARIHVPWSLLTKALISNTNTALSFFFANFKITPVPPSASASLLSPHPNPLALPLDSSAASADRRALANDSMLRSRWISLFWRDSMRYWSKSVD